jgi:hypothetical protein
MKIHAAAGSAAALCAIWATKSASVRVGPSEAVPTCPLATAKSAIKLSVPWRMYSNSRCSTRPGCIGMGGAFQGLDAGHFIRTDYMHPLLG